MFIRMRNLLSGLIIGIALASCGGGGGQLAEGGIGGTGISTGSITGFGSVYVNGVKYDTTNTTFNIENSPGSEGELKIGMVVTVKGNINADGVTGSATSIDFEDLLEGPIKAGSIDMVNNTLTVMNHIVHVTSNTQYTGTGVTDLSSLADNEVIEISGFYNDSFEIIATLIERTDSTNHEVTGKVTLITAAGSAFRINDTLTVNSAANVSQGDYIELYGTFDGAAGGGAGEFNATAFESRTEGFDVSDRDDAELEGLALGSCSPTGIDPLPCRFSLNGQIVEVSSSTEFDAGSHLDISVGTLLEVEGALVSGVLIAEEVEFENDAEVDAEVDTVGADNAGEKIITLTDIPALQVVISQTDTVFDTTGDYNDPTAGGTENFLRFRGMMNSSGQLVASLIEAASFPEVELEATIDSFNELAEEIIVMGVTVDTSTVFFTFDDGSDTGLPLTSAEFYNLLPNNQANIEVKGTLSGTGGTITWEEIELDL